MAAAGKTGRTKTRIEQLGYVDARPASVVLITGPEQFFADRAMRQIREELVSNEPDLEVHDIDAQTYGAGELFTLASPSLFAEPRLIRVMDADRASDPFLEDAKRYLAQPADGTTLVVRHSGGQRGKGLLDAIRGEVGAHIGAIEVSCPEVKRDDEREAFIRAELRRLGAQANAYAIRALMTAYRGSLGDLAGALEQLVSDHGSRITEEQVAEVTEGRVEAGAFNVADAATAGRAAEALVLLRQALSTGTEPFLILGALNMKVRAMARVFGASGTSGQLAKALGMAPWQVERAMRETRGWREADLARAVDLAAETEWLLKGGSRDTAYALERYVLFIASRGRRELK